MTNDRAPATASLGVPLLVPSVVVLALVSWAVLAAAMPALHHPVTGGVASLVLPLVGWVLMLSAMMLPAEIRYLRTYAALTERAQVLSADAYRGSPVLMFGLGYLAVWSAFGVAAVSLDDSVRAFFGPLSSGGEPVDRYVAAAYFFIAATYQRSALKDGCLAHCHTPMQFFLRNWRRGPVGGFRMGCAHGTYCLGCCWALMLLMFAFGMMNLVWMALLAALMFAEKAFRFGRRGQGAVFGFLIAMGVLSLLAPDLLPFHADPEPGLSTSICRSRGA